MHHPFVDVDLHEKAARVLRKTTYESLCTSCIAELHSMVMQASHEKFPSTGKDLEYEKHFYMKGELMVFTEYYHVTRGFCCESGCKHCAYGIHLANSTAR